MKEPRLCSAWDVGLAALGGVFGILLLYVLIRGINLLEAWSRNGPAITPF